MNTCPSFEDLNALVDGDLASDRELHVRRHLDVCATCRSGLSTVTAVKQAVGRAYATESPSPGLRRAVLAQLPKRRRAWRWWLAPAAALVLLTAGSTLWRSDHASPLGMFATALVADHIRSLTEPNLFETAISDPDGLSGWFSQRLAFPVTVHQLPDARLLGGRERTILGQHLALAFYDRGGERVSLFVTNANAVDDPVRSGFDAPQRSCADTRGYRICMHRAGKQLIGIVAHQRARPEELLTATESF